MHSMTSFCVCIWNFETFSVQMKQHFQSINVTHMLLKVSFKMEKQRGVIQKRTFGMHMNHNQMHKKRWGSKPSVQQVFAAILTHFHSSYFKELLLQI